MAPTSQLRIFILLFLASGAVLPGPSRASEEESKRTISVSATGTVKVTPDMVNISTGVESEAPAVGEALIKNTAAMTKVIDALKAEGVDSKDIQTTNFSVGPRYENREDGKPARIVGYNVSNSVYITVRDVSKLGEVLDRVASVGANTISGISFGVSNAKELENEARKRAMSDATAKAKVYAEAAGAELGPVLTISEESGYQPILEGRAAAPMTAAAKPVPIETGMESLKVRVHATWELK